MEGPTPERLRAPVSAWQATATTPLGKQHDEQDPRARSLPPPLPIKPGRNISGGGQPWARTLCAALLALSVGQAAEADPGDLDPSFDGDGRILTPFGAIDGLAPGSQEFPSAVALQADGKLVVAGSSFSADFGLGNLALARYNPDGSLDLSFGSGGRVLSALEAQDDPNSLAIQPDGKLLVANRTFLFDDVPRFGVSLNRFRPDGGVDENFGSGGRLIVDISSVDFFPDVAELVVLPSGKLVVGGGADSPEFEFTTDFALVRFNTDGSLDPSFGSGGKVLTDFTQISDVAPRSDTISKFLIQPDGKLVAVGMSSSFSADFVEKREVALARFNPDGSLDPSFGAGGRLLLDLGGDPSLSTLALQPDGKLVALMFGSGLLSPFVHFLVRFSADGSLDATFGSGGLAQITSSLRKL